MCWALFAMSPVLHAQDTNLRFPIRDSYDALDQDNRKIYGAQPTNVKTEMEYNPQTGNYEYKQTMGSLNYRPPSYLSFDEYNEYEW